MPLKYNKQRIKFTVTAATNDFVNNHSYLLDKKKPLNILQVIKLMLIKKAEAPGWEAGKKSNGVETFYLPHSL